MSTFQLVLITNYTDTYALFLYNETSWSRQTQSIVAGYTAADYNNYMNIEFTAPRSLLQMAEEVGNSGQIGQWVFDLTPSSDMMDDGEQACLQWAAEQESRGLWYTTLPACPCSRAQAFWDWRYSFFWGSGENCAVFVQGSLTSTTECCYDGRTGALLVGPPNGGGYRFFNPITSRKGFEEEDTFVPRRYCCQQSNLCEMYYKYRPSDDCSRYRPVPIGKLSSTRTPQFYTPYTHIC